MVTKYHANVQDAILKYGHLLVKKKKIRHVFEGNTRPLSLVDPNTKLVVNYQPDLYFICKNNKKKIIEVLDSEEKKQDIIIADIIRSILVENVDSIIFIHPGNDHDEMTIMAALKTMYKGLIDLGINEKDLPDDRRTAPYRITRKQAKNKNTLKKKICEYFGD